MNQIFRHDLALTNRTRMIAATLGVGAFLTQFDVTAIIIALPSIGNDLHMGVAGLTWVIDGYSLAFTAALLAAGSLADRFGRRRMLLTGNMVFLLASLVCGIARNGPELWAARAVQGIGAAFVVTGAIASIAALFPSPAARTRAFGITGVMGGIAMALGPTVGAAISATAGWRWIFLANVPLCLLVAVAIPRLIVEAEETARRPIQWAALAVLTAALGGVIEACLLARDSFLLMAVGLVVAALLFALFVRMQRRQALPMLDPVIFTSRPMGVAMTLLVAVSIGYWALLVYLPSFLVRAYGWTHDGAGAALMVATLPMLLLPPLAAHVVHYLGWRRLFGSALSCMAVGAVLLVIASRADAAVWGLAMALAGMAVIGAGAALVHPQLSGVVVELLPANASGMAAAVTVIARQGGFAIGVALLGAALPDAPPASGFAVVFAIAAAASVLGAAACLLLPRP